MAAGSETDLFLCPTTPGNTRVIINNPFQLAMKESKSRTGEDGPEEDVATCRTSLLKTMRNRLLRYFSPPKSIGRSLIRTLIVATGGLGVPFHWQHSQVFDGDNTLLARQSEYLRKKRLTYRDYLTPTSADTMPYAFRRWLDGAVAATERTMESSPTNEITETDIRSIVDAVIGGSTSDGAAKSESLPTRSREVILDRYHAHTKNCPMCSKALSKLERRRDLLERKAMPTLLGAVGVSLVSWLAALLGSGRTGIFAKSARLPLSMLVSFSLLSLAADTYAGWTKRRISKFYFVDYVHQDVS